MVDSNTVPSAECPPVARFAWLGFALIALLLAGCGGLRIHDPGRLQMANEAVALAAQVSTGSGDVFGPMEQNLASVQSTQQKLRKLTDAHELETFQVVLPRLSSNKIAERLVKAMANRGSAFGDLKTGEEQASQAVNAALDRQAIVTAVLDDKVKEDDTVATLARLQKRLDWVAQAGQALDGLHQQMAPASPKTSADGAVVRAVTEASGAVAGNKEAFDKALKAAAGSLKNVENAPTVTASLQLLRSVAEQAISTEQSRLLVMRQHLAMLQRLRNQLLVRDRVTVCNLLPAVIGQIYTALDAGTRKKIDTLVIEMKNTGRYQCLNGFDLTTVGDVTPLWAGGTLAEYVAANLKASGESAKSPELVGALGIVLFYERRLFDDVRLDLAREQHLYSIRLSRINAQQRAGLVHQLSEGLEVYYRGGVKPETVAELVLAAAQAGAIAFIGVRQ